MVVFDFYFTVIVCFAGRRRLIKLKLGVAAAAVSTHLVASSPCEAASSRMSPSYPSRRLAAAARAFAYARVNLSASQAGGGLSSSSLTLLQLLSALTSSPPAPAQQPAAACRRRIQAVASLLLHAHDCARLILAANSSKAEGSPPCRRSRSIASALAVVPVAVVADASARCCVR